MNWAIRPSWWDFRCIWSDSRRDVGQLCLGWVLELGSQGNVVAHRLAHLRGVYSCAHDTRVGRPSGSDLRGVWIFDGDILFLGSELSAQRLARLRMNRMLKMASLHSPDPRRAKTRPFPSFVPGLSKPATYRWERASRGWFRIGWVNCRYASGFSAPAALPNGHFEHPK